MPPWVPAGFPGLRQFPSLAALSDLRPFRGGVGKRRAKLSGWGRDFRKDFFHKIGPQVD